MKDSFGFQLSQGSVVLGYDMFLSVNNRKVLCYRISNYGAVCDQNF